LKIIEKIFCTYLLFWKICTYLFETLSLKNLLKKIICKITEKIVDTLASENEREFKNKIEFHALIYTFSSKKIKNKISCIQTCIFIQNNKK